MCLMKHIKFKEQVSHKLSLMWSHCNLCPLPTEVKPITILKGERRGCTKILIGSYEVGVYYYDLTLEAPSNFPWLELNPTHAVIIRCKCTVILCVFTYLTLEVRPMMQFPSCEACAALFSSLPCTHASELPRAGASRTSLCACVLLFSRI